MPKLKPKHYAILTILGTPLFIAFQNLDRVHLDFLIWDWSIPLIYIILSSVILGFLAGYLTRLFSARS